MTHTPHDLDAIIAGLSSYEHAAMQSRIVFISKRDTLIAKGLLTSDGGRDWEPLGQAVRARMMEGK